MHGLVGLLAALYAGQQTGRGDHVDVSMVDASVVTNDGMHYALEGMKVGVTNEVHETAGGLLMLAGEFKISLERCSIRPLTSAMVLESTRRFTGRKNKRPPGCGKAFF